MSNIPEQLQKVFPHGVPGNVWLVSPYESQLAVIKLAVSINKTYKTGPSRLLHLEIEPLQRGKQDYGLFYIGTRWTVDNRYLDCGALPRYRSRSASQVRSASKSYR